MRIHVSSLREYEFCPRVIYLKNVLKIIPERSVERDKGLVGHAIRKELCLRQTKLLKKVRDIDEIESLLLDELDHILKDVQYIYKNLLVGIDPMEYVLEIKPQLLSEIKTLKDRLHSMVDELGIEKTLRLLTPWRVEYSIRSNKLKLSGRIDKVMVEDVHIPVEIKTGEASEGVWEGDRVQICAYSLLLEEKFNELIPYGFVEYTQVQEKRPVMTTEKLRRDVINARDDVIDILDGKVPEICPHGSGKKCEACGFSEKCYEV